MTAIDALGGLEIEVSQDIRRYEYIDGENSSVIEIPAGWHHMDGAMALTYVRSRYESSDYERMRRQRQVLQAVREKAQALQIPISQLPQLFWALGRSNAPCPEPTTIVLRL